MEFTLNSVYDQTAVTAMARALRKTVRKKHSRRSHVFGWIVVAFSLLLLLSEGFAVDFCRFIETATGKTVQPVK